MSAKIKNKRLQAITMYWYSSYIMLEVLAPKRLNKNNLNKNTVLLIIPKKGARDSRGDNVLPQSGVQVVL